MTDSAAHLQRVIRLNAPAAAESADATLPQWKSQQQMCLTLCLAHTPTIFSPGSSPGIASAYFQAIWPFPFVWFYPSLWELPQHFLSSPISPPPCIQGERRHPLTGQPRCLGQTSLSKTVSTSLLRKSKQVGMQWGGQQVGWGADQRNMGNKQADVKIRPPVWYNSWDTEAKA